MAKLLTSQNIIIFIVVVVLLWALYMYFNPKLNLFDSMVSSDISLNVVNTIKDPSLRETGAQHIPSGNGYAKDVVNPSELLPKDSNADWGTLNPNLGANDVMIPDLLQAGHNYGIDTVANTMKNANLQLRSDPIIPVKEVSIWNQSSYGPDLMRVPLELGNSC